MRGRLEVLDNVPRKGRKAVGKHEHILIWKIFPL